MVCHPLDVSHPLYINARNGQIIVLIGYTEKQYVNQTLSKSTKALGTILILRYFFWIVTKSAFSTTVLLMSAGETGLISWTNAFAVGIFLAGNYQILTPKLENNSISSMPLVEPIQFVLQIDFGLFPESLIYKKPTLFLNPKKITSLLHRVNRGSVHVRLLPSISREKTERSEFTQPKQTD